MTEVASFWDREAAAFALEPDHGLDAVVCRHLLWAMSDTDAALQTWSELLRPGRVLLLVGWQWSTGAGLASVDVVDSLRRLGRRAVVHELTDDRLWGCRVDDDRYLVVSSR